MRVSMPFAWIFLAGSISAPSLAGEPFAIEVVDAETGRGVPLIELKTVNEVRYVTDSAGLVAFDEPGLMGLDVFFHVSGPGYEFPRDGMGYRGKALRAAPGGSARIEVKRLNVAERLYRSTGAGIYRDSVLLGRPVPIKQPVLDGQVLGQDSVLEATFQGKIHWFWGDTNRPSYPLGTFGTPTATSRRLDDGGLDPEVGVDYEYALAKDGFVAPSADLEGKGPTWLDGLTVLVDPATGAERMFAAFSKVRPSMAPYRRGIAEFDPSTGKFREATAIPMDAPVRPFGHPFLDGEPGDRWVYFADPVPLARVRADVGAFLDLARYESYTCLLPGSTLKEPKVDRDDRGRARYLWRAGAPGISHQAQERLIRDGVLKRDEAMISLRDVETGRPITVARGSTYFNPHRRKWAMVATETGGGPSNLGEVWYAEAPSMLGPWAYARKVASHPRYSFYNPKQHPTFSKGDGRIIFFEGTYVTTFSGNDHPTPRYDYNQITYKLDLDDPRLNLPAPAFGADGLVSYYALERPGDGTVPAGDRHALAPSDKPPSDSSVPLWEVSGAPSAFKVDPTDAEKAAGKVAGWAWKSPSTWAPPRP